MSDKQKLSCFVAIGLLALLVVVFVVGCGEKRNYPPLSPPVGTAPEVKTELLLASFSFNKSLGEFYRQFDGIPSRVDSSKWKSVRSAAQEINTKAKALIALSATIEGEIADLKLEDGKVAKRLKEMIDESKSLYTEARDDIVNLPEQMQPLAKKEVVTWQEAMKIITAFRRQYTTLITYYDGEMSVITGMQPMLDRMERGSRLYMELADLGESIEKSVSALNAFADELNGILDMFESLETTTRKAIRSTTEDETTVA